MTASLFFSTTAGYASDGLVEELVEELGVELGEGSLDGLVEGLVVWLSASRLLVCQPSACRLSALCSFAPPSVTAFFPSSAAAFAVQRTMGASGTGSSGTKVPLSPLLQ
jgi:hypothetical protein